MELRPINDGDLLYIVRNLRSEDRREIFATRGSEDPNSLVDDCMAVAAAPHSVAMVAWLERPIAVIGAAKVWPGVFDVWCFGTDEFQRIGFALTKWIRRTLIPAVIEAGAHRAHCRSIEGHAEAHAWLKMLGAEPQHTFKAWGKDKQDFILFEWQLSEMIEKGLA